MPASLKRAFLIWLPFWLIGLGFVYWSFFLAVGDPFPGFRIVRSGIGVAVGAFPYTIFIQWMYETGRMKRPKPRPWVRKLTGAKPDDKS
jgi:hypothetical protein